MNKNYNRILSAAILLLLVAGLYIYNFRQDLPGADDNASAVIGQIAPAYKPWCKSISFDLTKEMEALFVRHGMKPLKFAGVEKGLTIEDNHSPLRL